MIESTASKVHELLEAEDQGASDESRTAGGDQHRAMSVAVQQAQLRVERVREVNAATLSKAFSPEVKVVKKVAEVTVEVAIDRTPKKKQFLQKVCADSVAFIGFLLLSLCC